MPNFDALENAASRAAGLHDKLAASHPALVAGKMRCATCAREATVNSAHCLRHGWPECCGSAMTLLSEGDGDG